MPFARAARIIFTERYLGKKVFSDSLSIFELAYPSFDSISGFNKKVQEELKFAPGLAYFDDEGEEKKNFPKIKSGVIENFILMLFLRKSSISKIQLVLLDLIPYLPLFLQYLLWLSCREMRVKRNIIRFQMLF
jgi:hypothetical protein